ncbi:SusC/RagA family TonB-linked outer membrane protein [Sinomicrobium sp. M5D2P17]
MKTFYISTLLLFLLCIPFGAHAQTAVSGTVTDNSGPLPGVNVVVKGTTVGTTTDFDGNYSIDASSGDILVFSYIGYRTLEKTVSGTTLDIVLEEDTQQLDEVVLIGYGQVKKKDATGSVTTVKSDDFNNGMVVSPDQLIAGKTAGVQITTSGGEPGAGANIRIRGGASLNASNDPLIVIDGVPVDKEGVAGISNPLNIVNPNDIESFTVLKDASAAAIYGSRASNGVIIITTKKGSSGELQFNYNAKTSVSTVTRTVDAFSANAFRDLVQTYGSDAQQALLGESNTNWQDIIFRDAISFDQNFSVKGQLFGDTPFRASVGYTEQDGILMTSSLERWTGSFGVTPRFFDNHLKVDINVKGIMSESRFGDTGAIGSAILMNPTNPVYDSSMPFGGYYEEFTNGNVETLAPRNPLALLKQRDNTGDVKRSVGNIELDYKFHFLPELRANLNLGYDVSTGERNDRVFEESANYYRNGTGYGHLETESQNKRNLLMDFYLNYSKSFEDRFITNLDITAGHSYQSFTNNGYKNNHDYINDQVIVTRYYNPVVIASFFGRANVSIKNKYLFTATLRRDGSSRFDPDVRWGNFPSAAFAWNIYDEPWLENSNTLSNLKLRMGWGITGQQDLPGRYFPYLSVYLAGTPQVQYPFGDNYYTTYRPNPYSTSLTWEETTTYNAGLDYGFLDNRITGAVDVYYRKTKDLLSEVSTPAGSNLSNVFVDNVGTMENKGVEFEINATPIQTDNFSWNLGANFTWNSSEVTGLNADTGFISVQDRNISGGTGLFNQVHAIGETPYSFYIYEQVYDENGKPVENVFVDRNGDGVVDDNDRYIHKSALPDVYYGFTSQFRYKKWDLNMVFRGQAGNYVYNNIDSNVGIRNGVFTSSTFLTNIVDNYNETGFVQATDQVRLSDYYIQNASFLRLDNITLGYNAGKFLGNSLSARIYGSVQNVFTVTGYDGLDPEVQNGNDYNIYPRPRTFLLGLSLDF